MLLDTKGFCCPGVPDSFCSCGGKCCSSAGDCFIEGTPLDPKREFCCSAEGGTVCQVSGVEVCCKESNCDLCINQTGRFGSYRRPGR
jgi:hypothetical protein